MRHKYRSGLSYDEQRILNADKDAAFLADRLDARAENLKKTLELRELRLAHQAAKSAKKNAKKAAALL